MTILLGVVFWAALATTIVYVFHQLKRKEERMGERETVVRFEVDGLELVATEISARIQTALAVHEYQHPVESLFQVVGRRTTWRPLVEARA